MNRNRATLWTALPLLAFTAVANAAEAPPPPRPTARVWRFAPGTSDTVVRPALVSRGYLGVQLIDLTTELRAYFGAAPTEGVLISRVEPDSPAAEAGLRAGDVVISVDGESVDGSFSLANEIAGHGGDDVIEIELLRDRATQRVTATLTQQERPQLDVSTYFRLCDEEGEDCPEIAAGTVGPIRGHAPVLPLDAERFSAAIHELEERLDSPQWRQRVFTFQDRISELEERIRQLEERLEERDEG